MIERRGWFLALSFMQEQEIHIRDYLRIIDKRRYTVITFFIVTFAVVLIGTLTTTPTYIASTDVLIEKNAPEALISRYSYESYDPEFLDTQYQIIKSFKVAQKVVKALAMDEKYSTYFPESEGSVFSVVADWFKEFFKVLLKVVGIEKSSKADTGFADKYGIARSRADELAQMVSSGISVAPVGDSRVVTISYESPNPVLAQLVVNSVASAYKDELLEIRLASSGYTVNWMTQKAVEERSKLAESEKALQAYSKANDIVTVENRIAIIPQKLSELSTQMTKAETRRKELEGLLSRIEKTLAAREDLEAIPAIATMPALQSLRDQIIKAEQNIIELSKKFGEKHPVMIRAVSDLNVLQEKKGLEISRVIESIRNEYELARSNEKDLNTLLANTKSEAIALNERFIQYGIIEREVNSNQLLYDALIKNIKEQGATEQTQTVTVWIVKEAAAPQAPAKPRVKLNLLLGLVMGLFGGIGFAFFIEYLDNTIKSPDDAEKRFGISVLGIVELYNKKKHGMIEDAMQIDAFSTFAESYKAIRSGVLLSSVDSPPKRILVSSMSVKEGKTTTTANLAMTIAQVDFKVLVIDADLRKPQMHKFFGIDNFKGLSTYLCGVSDMDIIVDLPEKGISVIPSGPMPPNPSELLSSERLKELLAAVENKYDLIILDSPPLLQVTDSLILSKIVDGTILVAHAGKTTYDFFSRGVNSLKDIKSNILGMVINAMDIKKSKYYNYGYYYHSYFTEYENWKDAGERRRRSADRRRRSNERRNHDDEQGKIRQIRS